MVQEWTDGRLDDFDRKVDQRFDRIEAEVRAFRSEMKDEFKAVRGEIGAVRGSIEGVQRTMLFGFITMAAAIVSGFAAIATQI